MSGPRRPWADLERDARDNVRRSAEDLRAALALLDAVEDRDLTRAADVMQRDLDRRKLERQDPAGRRVRGHLGLVE